MGDIWRRDFLCRLSETKRLSGLGQVAGRESQRSRAAAHVGMASHVGVECLGLWHGQCRRGEALRRSGDNCKAVMARRLGSGRGGAGVALASPVAHFPAAVPRRQLRHRFRTGTGGRGRWNPARGCDHQA